MAPLRTRESRRKPITELKRPRRRLGDQLREVLSCPLCVGSRIDVIRWGEKTTRFQCDTCGLRFSLDLEQLAQTLRQPSRPGVFEHVGGGFPELMLAEKTGLLDGGGAEELGEFVDMARLVYPGGPNAWTKKPPTNEKRGRAALTADPVTHRRMPDEVQPP